MKNILLFVAILFSSVIVKSQNQKINPIWCTVGDAQHSNDPSINKPSINNFITNSNLIDPNGVIVIPVVFHILYDPSKPEQFIPQNVINTQIARLNADFRKLNTDIGLVPTVWAPLAADLKFEFKLACIDPNGVAMPIPGIVYKPIPVNYEFCDVGAPPIQYELCGDAKLSALNGDDAWPTDTYLNIWVFDMVNSSLLGHATFPELRFMPNVIVFINGNPVSIPRTALDGIELDYRVVGDPSQSPTANKGRVLNHEVGHWLGLRHTYQRNQFEPICTPPGDFVDDTPPQAAHTIGCGIFPLTDACTPQPPGVMFMNYMDVTQDECKFFYTVGQRDRARSYFSATGPPETRYPFIQNYFGIKHFTSNPYIVQNNTITVLMKNPACLPVTYSYTGPVTEVSHDDQKIIFSVACGVSGTLSLTAISGNYTDTYTFDFVNGACVPPPGPIKIIEVPNVQSAKPVDVIYDNNGNSVLGYASIDNIEIVDPENQEVGFGILKFDVNGIKVFNKQYKLAGKKLYLKKIRESYYNATTYYYVLAGIKDGIGCNCDDQKTLILKIDKNDGTVLSTFKLDGFYQTELHEPFDIEVVENYLYVMTYGFDKTNYPAPSSSKINIIELNLQNNATRAFYTYDPSSNTNFIKPTQMFGVNWQSSISSLPVMFYGGLVSADKRFNNNKPFSFYSCVGCLLLGNIYEYDNSFVKTANIQQFDGIMTIVSQGINGKLYFTNDNGSQAYYNQSFELLSEKNLGNLAGRIVLGSQVYGIASGRYNISNGNNVSGYGTVLFGNGGGIIYQKFNDLNQDFVNMQVDNNIALSNDLFEVPVEVIAFKEPLAMNEKNKFYNYLITPDACDLNVSFQSVPVSVNITSGLTTVLNNAIVNISSVNISETPDLPVNINYICYDIGAISGFSNTNQNNLQRKENIKTADNFNSNKHQQILIKKEDKTSISSITINSIEIYNTAGQLLKKINSDLEYADVLKNNKASGLMPGLYFVRVLYKDRTSKTIKRFLQ